MTPTPEPQPSQPRRRSRAKLLAAFWIVLLVADVTNRVVFGSLLSWSAASSILLALGGLLLSLGLRRHERGLPHGTIGKAGFIVVLFAAVAILIDILVT